MYELQNDILCFNIVIKLIKIVSSRHYNLYKSRTTINNKLSTNSLTGKLTWSKSSNEQHISRPFIVLANFRYRYKVALPQIRESGAKSVSGNARFPLSGAFLWHSY